jgi:hypothetical protein
VTPQFSETWRSGASGKGNNTRLWPQKHAPHALDDVTIAASGVYTVTVNAAADAQSLMLNNTGAKLLVSIGGLLTATFGRTA